MRVSSGFRFWDDLIGDFLPWDEVNRTELVRGPGARQVVLDAGDTKGYAVGCTIEDLGPLLMGVTGIQLDETAELGGCNEQWLVGEDTLGVANGIDVCVRC